MNEHDQELDELIAAGWGDVDQHKIPKDWRQRKGPGVRAWSDKRRRDAFLRRGKSNKKLVRLLSRPHKLTRREEFIVRKTQGEFWKIKALAQIRKKSLKLMQQRVEEAFRKLQFKPKQF